MDIAETLGIRTDQPVQSLASLTCEGEEDIGLVQWMGSGPLTLSAASDCRAVCRAKLEKPLYREVLMVYTSHTVPFQLVNCCSQCSQ